MVYKRRDWYYLRIYGVNVGVVNEAITIDHTDEITEKQLQEEAEKYINHKLNRGKHKMITLASVF